MDHVEPEKPAIEAAPRGWPLFLAGSLLFVLGPVGYYVQLRSRNLGAPWYLPILSTLGVVLMILALRRRGGVLRVLGVAFFAVVCGLEWFAPGRHENPAYTGPAPAACFRIHRSFRRRQAVYGAGSRNQSPQSRVL